MVDKVTFMETLRSVAEITKASNGPLSREEINQYFSNMELTEEQQEMVYQYFLHPNNKSDEVENIQDSFESTEMVEEEKTNLEEKEQQPKSHLFQTYLEDVGELPEIPEEEENKLYFRLLEGEEEVIQAISDIWLKRIIKIAEQYSSRNVILEDVIQEGNIALLLAMENILGKKEKLDVEEYLHDRIKEKIVQYIDEIVEEEDWENMLVAKASLVYEAKKKLAQDLGRLPSTQELCEYTKMSQEEITDILSLYKKIEKK